MPIDPCDFYDELTEGGAVPPQEGGIAEVDPALLNAITYLDEQRLHGFARAVEKAAAELSRLSAIVKAQKEALEPFAREADNWHEMGDTRPIADDTKLTVGDLRRARALSDTE